MEAAPPYVDPHKHRAMCEAPQRGIAKKKKASFKHSTKKGGVAKKRRRVSRLKI